MARSFIQEPNTAPTAPHSCSCGSSGKVLPVFALISALNSATISLSASTERSVSSVAPNWCFFFSRITSNGSRSFLSTGLRSRTTSPYIATKRR